MGLRWGEVEVDWIQRGYGTDGELWAQITGYGPYSAWIHPRICGEPVLLRDLASWAEARRAVDRYVDEAVEREEAPASPEASGGFT